eukprot:5004266-Pyramimonas_sp.AAC.1
MMVYWRVGLQAEGGSAGESGGDEGERGQERGTVGGRRITTGAGEKTGRRIEFFGGKTAY